MSSSTTDNADSRECLIAEEEEDGDMSKLRKDITVKTFGIRTHSNDIRDEVSGDSKSQSVHGEPRVYRELGVARVELAPEPLKAQLPFKESLERHPLVITMAPNSNQTL